MHRPAYTSAISHQAGREDWVVGPPDDLARRHHHPAFLFLLVRHDHTHLRLWQIRTMTCSRMVFGQIRREHAPIGRCKKGWPQDADARAEYDLYVSTLYRTLLAFTLPRCARHTTYQVAFKLGLHVPKNPIHRCDAGRSTT